MFGRRQKHTMPNKKEKKQFLGLKIADAAKASGVSKQTIEYYIMLGLIEPIRVHRERRSQRFFDKELIKRIKLVRRLNDSGYTLRDIRETYFKNNN